MIKGDVFRKEIKSNAHKSGKTVQKCVILVCDNCGAEEETSLARANRVKQREGIHLCRKCANRFPFRQMPKSKDHKSWKHGTTNTGYYRSTLDGRRVLLHIVEAEKMLGRKLCSGETVHHIDMNKMNNSFSNLHVYATKSDHRKAHGQMKRIGYKLLNNLIFFNSDFKVYSLSRSSSNPSNADDCPSGSDIRTYTKTDPRTKATYEFFSNKGDHIRFHVWLMERKIGRRLYRDEQVHHIDGNTLNNRLSNLIVLTKQDHTRCHHSLERAVAELFCRGLVKFDRANGRYYL